MTAKETHQTCPDCGGHDCLTIFDDGGTYCHQCFKAKGVKSKVEVYDQSDLTLEHRGYRGISKELTEKYNVLTGVDSDGKEVTRVYPYPHRPKVRILPKDFSRNKGFTNDHLLGMDFFNAGTSKKLTIVEGEDDWLSSIQMLGDRWPVVALPGSMGCIKQVLKNPKCYNYLKSFDSIIISTDNDEAGDKTAEVLTRAFPGKCYRVPMTNHKDPNEYLVAGESSDYLYAWMNAKKYTPPNVLNTPDQFLSLYREAPDHQYVPTGIEALDDKILGLMQGHFTVIKAPTGIGKCLDPNQGVMMWDGSTKKAKDVLTGDKLMGDDSTPRTVLGTTTGVDQMYRIVPTKGEPWVCNSKHMISLVNTTTGAHFEISMEDYLKQNKTFKHTHKLYRKPVKMFGHAEGTSSRYHPYLIGAYLGDGHTHRSALTMGPKKAECLEFVSKCLEVTGNKTREEDKGSCIELTFKGGDFYRYIKEYVTGDRRIPGEYKLARDCYRKHLLAGLLDTDGSVTDGGAEITQKSEQLADDILFVARSLGLAAYKKKKISTIKSLDFSGEYWRVNISGDMTGIPTRRLKFKKREQKKDVLRTGFKVEPLGLGEYAGFQLDGNHRFLLDDFTVTHNSEFMRYLEYQMLKQGIPIATWHLEETKVRGLLGLVSYELKDNLTRQDLIEEKGKDKEVEEAIVTLTQDENLYQFYLDDSEGADELCDQIRYFSEVCGCQFVFFEPIQDVISSSSEDSKEQALADLSVRLSKLAATLGIGIVTIAHTNENGDPKYCKMIGQRASVIIDLERNKDEEDPDEKNTTYLKVEKNRPASVDGPAGCMLFDTKSFTMSEKLLPF